MRQSDSKGKSEHGNASLNPAVKPEELDRIFDLLLFLLSIITAVLFQYSCTIDPLRITVLKPNLTQQEFFQEVDKVLTFDLRMYFIPIFALIALWVFNRLSLKTEAAKKRFISEFCYTFGFAILAFNIYIFIIVSFPSLAALGSLSFLGMLLFQFLISSPFVYYYEIPFINQANITTRVQRLRVVWMPIFAQTYKHSFVAWIVLIAIFVINLIPFMRL